MKIALINLSHTLVTVKICLFFENQDGTETICDRVTIKVAGKVVRSDRSGTAVSFDEDYKLRTKRCPLSGINSQITDSTPSKLENCEEKSS